MNQALWVNQDREAMDEPLEEVRQAIWDLQSRLRFLRASGVRVVARRRESVEPRPEAAPAGAALPEQARGFSATVPAARLRLYPKAPERPPQKLPEGSSRRQTSLFAPVGRPDPVAEEKRVRRPDPLSPAEAQERLDALRREIGDCTRCRLHQGRNNIVFGEGNPRARLLFAGEGPGREEDRSGRPFVGRAGQLLERILAAMGLKREEVYIGNVIKCRPPDNRTPQDDEMHTCGIFLAGQIDIINPGHIVCLGSTAARYLLGTSQSMAKLRGRFFEHSSGARVRCTYHPAYLLRNPGAKKMVWEDMQTVMAEIQQPAEGDK